MKKNQTIWSQQSCKKILKMPHFGLFPRPGEIEPYVGIELLGQLKIDIARGAKFWTLNIDFHSISPLMVVGGPHISPVLWLRKIFRPNLASSANVLSKCVTLARLPDASCNFSFEIHKICSLALQPAPNHLNTLQLTNTYYGACKIRLCGTPRST